MKQSITPCGRRFAVAAVALGLGFASLPAPAPALAAETLARSGGGGAATVQGLYDTLLAVMRKGQALGPSGRYAEIAPVVRRSFDIPFMTRLAVGPDWASLSDAQRRQVTHAFARYIAATYADRFDSYGGEQLQVLGAQPSGGGSIIVSRIVKSDGQPVSINYLMRDNGGSWQIADVYLDGTISELATRRSEFAAILRSGGINGLIQALNTKADALAAAS